MNTTTPKLYSGAVNGLQTQLVEVETDISYGLKNYDIVGLPDKAVEESRERVRAAIKTCGFKPPLAKPERVLTNLAPADLKKEGSLYDLPIALSYLLAAKQVEFNWQDKVIAGELALDGRLRPIKGALLFSQMAKANGFSEILLPQASVKEASLCQLEKDNTNFKVIGLESLSQTVNYLEGKVAVTPSQPDFRELIKEKQPGLNLDWIKGQNYAKRAMAIAAAGSHNLLMLGPPGGGKTLLAKALPSILPPLTKHEILELTRIYSIVGLLSEKEPLIRKRPFRAAHHSASKAAIIGGGNPVKPGEITLAHRGVLFLDEFPEFRRDVIEALRQPLEDRKITIMRASQKLNFPCNFSLIAAANPCPCGYLNDPVKACSCVSSQIAKYRRKLSGPIVDRIDIFVELTQVKFEKLEAQERGTTSKIKEQVLLARKRQKQRFQKENILTNSEMQLPQIKKYCSIDLAGKNILRNYVNSGKLTARGYHRVLKTARSIADLANSEKILTEHITEALMYRIRQEES